MPGGSEAVSAIDFSSFFESFARIVVADTVDATFSEPSAEDLEINTASLLYCTGFVGFVFVCFSSSESV